MTNIFIGILGEFEVRVASLAVRIPSGKQQLLLAALTLRASQLVSTDELVARLWDDQPPHSARITLRGYVKRLRSVLPPTDDGAGSLIEGVPGGYRFSIGPDEVDLTRFRRLCHEARECPDPQRRMSWLNSALAQWRGRPLSGLEPCRWVEETVASLEEELLQAVESWSDLVIEHSDPGATTLTLSRLLADHPFRESLWHRLIRGLHRAGRSAEALNRYEEVRRLLAEQLGVEPSGPLRALHQQILTDDKREAQARSDVNGHRMRPAPDAVGQAFAATFVGRQRELAALDGFHECGRCWLVVIDGGAGVGKTALAARWADRAAPHFSDGQLRINLRGFHPDPPLSPHEALTELVRQLGVPDDEIPDGFTAQTTLFRDLTSRRRMLVVLDNARDAEQVRLLLPGPGGLILITSQCQLRGLVAREGARRLTVPPLDLEEGRALVAAFYGQPVSDHELATVDELTELCAGMPLALRIAMERLSRIPGLSLKELVEELRDEGSRLNLLETGDDGVASVRAALSRSQQLLGEAETVLLKRLARHDSAEFDLDDAVGLVDGDRTRTWLMLDTLVSTSVVEQRSLRRYRMHPLQRAVARELSPV